MRYYRDFSYRYDSDNKQWLVFDEAETLVEMCQDESEVREYIDYIIDSEHYESDYNDFLHQADYTEVY